MTIERKTDVLVVGAGPVGLFTALSLAERGLAVQVVDKEWRGATHSYALALHPRSLRLLDEYGAADELLERGHQIEKIAFYRGDERAGEIDLTHMSGAFPFVLVAPQSALEHVLGERLRKHGVKIAWNHQVLDFRQDAEGVHARVAQMEKYQTGYPIAHSEWVVERELEVNSKFLVGTDGYHSQTRKTLGAAFPHLGEPEAFCVFEFPGRLPFTHEVRVAFSGRGTNVVWPLDEQRGRFSFQVDAAKPPETDLEHLRQLVRERAPWFNGEIAEVLWTATVLFERRLVDRFGKGRIWLAGDSAHITGPVGAQSMNVGLREAHDLAERMSSIIKSHAGLERLDGYGTERLAEWRTLLDGVKTSKSTPAWVLESAGRILSCMPASAEELPPLLAQVGLSL